MKKVIRINTPDGQYALDLKLVAEDRASYYRGKTNKDEWLLDVDYVMNDDYEGIDWVLNNSNYEDWEEKTVKLNDSVKVTEDNFWTDSDDFEIILIEE